LPDRGRHCGPLATGLVTTSGTPSTPLYRRGFVLSPHGTIDSFRREGRMHFPSQALSVARVAALVAIATFAAGAQAQSPQRGQPHYVYVTAESRYSTKTVTAPVRSGPAGRLEVRLPGGTWLECGLSCRETLRRETVDFWQGEGRGSPRGGDINGPGYFQFRF
jgi:hypothetical protein